jgi:type I restriction enzyme S subunit
MALRWGWERRPDVSEWREVFLEDVADELTVGYVGPMASEYVPNGIPFLRSQNVEPLRVIQEDIKFITPQFHKRISKSALSPGDVVIVRTGKPGACTVMPDSIPVANCSDLVIVRCGNKLDARFLAYYVNTVAADHVSAHLVGAVQQHFNVGSARKLKMLLPEIGEQRAIASVLGSLDDKIELNRRMNETLEALAQSLFKSWFVDATQSALPKGWRESVLSECCENIFSGGTPSTQAADYWGGDIPWLSSGETRNRFIIDTEKTITSLGVENSSTRPARAGSTVIASAGQGHTRGQTSLLTFDSYINQSVVVLVADKSVSSDLFLFFDLARRYEQFRAMSDSQSSRGSLTTKLLAEMKVVVPPRELISKFDETVTPMTKKIIANLHESRTLAALRDALLPKLLSGELRVPTQTKSEIWLK